jgi:hypothetical protein
MVKDPIVEEMRNAGRKIQEECGNDFHRYFLRIVEGTEKLKKEGWKVVSEVPEDNQAGKTVDKAVCG